MPRSARSAIARRMGDASATPSSRGGSNYRKVLFSPDDMASFENLLDQVEDVDAGRARWKPPRDVAEEDAGEDVYARGGIRAWCTGLNVAVLVVALATAFVSFDLARSYVLARSSAAVVIDETLERAADPRGGASPLAAATRGPAAPAATALAAAAGEGVVARPEPSSSPVGGGGGGLVDLAKAHLVAASATAKRGIAGILDAFDEPGGTTRDDEGGDAVAEASGNDDDATGPAPPSPPRRFAKGPKTKTAGASQDDSPAGASQDDSPAGASRDDSLADSNAALESEEARRERHAREDEARRERHEREDRERAARHAMEDELRERQRAKETAERAEEAGAEENASEANDEAEEAKEADVEVAASTGDGERGARPSGTVGGGDYDDATR